MVRVIKKIIIFFVIVLIFMLIVLLSEKIIGSFSTAKTIELNKSLFKKNFIADDKFVVKRVKKIRVVTEAESILFADEDRITEADISSKNGNYTVISMKSGKVTLSHYNAMGYESYNKTDKLDIKKLLIRIKKLNKNKRKDSIKNHVYFVTNSKVKIFDNLISSINIECYEKSGKNMIWQEFKFYKQQKDSFNCVKKFIFLNDKKLLALKGTGNASMIAVYDLGKGSFTKTIKANINNFAVSADKKKIAYLTTDEKGEQVVYVGALKENKIQKKWIIYKTFNDITDLIWSNDGKELFLNEKETSDGSVIYQYLLGE